MSVNTETGTREIVFRDAAASVDADTLRKQEAAAVEMAAQSELDAARTYSERIQYGSAVVRGVVERYKEIMEMRRVHREMLQNGVPVDVVSALQSYISVSTPGHRAPEETDAIVRDMRTDVDQIDDTTESQMSMLQTLHKLGAIAADGMDTVLRVVPAADNTDSFSERYEVQWLTPPAEAN